MGKKLALVYWSGTGNTEMMAETIADVLEEYDSSLIYDFVSDANVEDVAKADRIFLGCPAMTAEDIEEFEFRPFFEDLKPHLEGKECVLFGSYDWGGGQWLESWKDEVEAFEGKVIASYKIQWDPDEDELEELRESVTNLMNE